MIKEELQYIVGLGEANLLDVEGCTYSDKPLEKVSYIPYPEPIKLKTLSSFVEYIISESTKWQMERQSYT